MDKKNNPNPKPEKKSKLYWEIEKNEDIEDLSESPMETNKPHIRHGKKNKKTMDAE